jgi:hypothetical protein
MRRTALLGLGVTVPVLLLAADGVAHALWVKEAFESAFYQFVSAESELPIPAVPAPLKALAATQRKATVESLGARAKAYYASEAFKRRWIQNHGGDYRDPEEAKRKGQNEEMRKQAQANANKSLADMEKMMPMMPPAMQAQMRAQLDKAKADQAKQAAKENEQKEKKEAKASTRETVVMPDAKVALRGALQRFLRASEGVDFEASLRHQDQRSFFNNPAYEAKPEVWKACFRAGRTTTEAARAYAKAWLAELG